MTIEAISSIGTCVAFSDVLPATEDQAGYEALTWVDWPAVLNYGDVGGTDDITKITPVCDGIVQKIYGPRDNGTQNMDALYDGKDPAQILVRTAYLNRERVAVRLTLATGDVIYYIAIVSAAPIAAGGASDALMIKPIIEITSEIVDVIAP